MTYVTISTPTSGTIKSSSIAVHWTSAFRGFVLGAQRAAQGAGPRVPAGRCRPNEAHANPAAHVNGGDRDVIGKYAAYQGRRDHFRMTIPPEQAPPCCCAYDRTWDAAGFYVCGTPHRCRSGKLCSTGIGPIDRILSDIAVFSGIRSQSAGSSHR